MTVPRAAVAVWDLSPLLPAVGGPWDGLVGSDILGRVVARRDYEHQQVTFIDPETFTPSRNAAVLPVTLLGNLPVVRGTILLPGRETIEANLAIDSGANGLHLTAPFTHRNRVPEAITRRLPSSATGAGGNPSYMAGPLGPLYSTRSERLLMGEMDSNLLFR